MPSSRRIPLVAALLGGLAALPGMPSPAASAAVVDATVIVGGYEVFASLAEADGAVSRRVVAGLQRDGDVLATTIARPREDGSVALPMVTSGARRHVPVRLLPGDRVTIALEDDPVGARTLTLPPLTAAATAGGLIEGTAPPGTRLTVTAASLDGQFARFNPVAGPDGRWSVDPAPGLVLGAGTSGAAFYSQDDVLWQASWTLLAIRPDAPEAPVPGDGAFTAPLAAGASALWLRMPSGVVANATVTSADGLTRTHGRAVAWSGGGAETRLVLRDARGRPTPLRPGDALDVALDDGRRVHAALPSVSAIEVSPAGDRVGGLASPGAQVAVWPIGSAAPAMATADEAGAWEAVVAPSGAAEEAGVVDVIVVPNADARAGAERRAWRGGVAAPWTADRAMAEAGEAVDHDAPGVRVRAYAPAVTVLDATLRAVEGRGVAGEPVSLAVLDGAGELATGAAASIGPDGRFALALFDDRHAVQPLSPGDRIRVEGTAGAVASWPAAPLLPRARAGRDVVEGAAAPGSTVTVTVGAETRATTADASGTWRVDFDEAIDLQPGVGVAVRARLPGGPVQDLAFPVFRASVQSRGSSARIEGPPGLAARVEVARDGDELASGECTIVRTDCTALLAAPAGESVALAPGDEVLVIPSEGSPAALDVIELSAHIDRSGSDVAGAAPPNESVRVAFMVPPGRPAPKDAVVGSDFNGVFDYELGRAEWELLAPGIRADVYYTLPSGHQVFATAVVEQIVLAPSTARWEGLAEPSATIDGTLSRGGRAVGTAGATAGTDGAYTAELRDAAGQPVVMQPGDILALNDGRRRADIAIPPLVAWFEEGDGPADVEPTGWATTGQGAWDGAVIGWSMPEQPVRVEHHVLAYPGRAPVEVASGLVDAFGTLSLGGGAVSPDALSETWVALTLPSGDEMRLRVAAGGPAGRVALPVGWR